MKYYNGRNYPKEVHKTAWNKVKSVHHETQPSGNQGERGAPGPLHFQQYCCNVPDFIFICGSATNHKYLI